LQISALQLNGINIYKLRINSPFKVVAIDISVFESRISRNIIREQIMENIVTKINNEDLLLYHDNMSAANLLATTDIILITMYSPTEY